MLWVTVTIFAPVLEVYKGAGAVRFSQGDS